MKFSLTITDASAADIGKLMAALNGSAAVAGLTAVSGSMPNTPIAPPMPANSGDDDESGPVNANAPATDKEGMPWDERIHSKNKATNADGTWRKRRGVDAATVTAIEKELTDRAASQPAPAIPTPMMPTAPAVPTMPTMPPVPTMPVPPQAAPPVAAVPPMPAAPEQPAASQQPPAPAAALDFNGFMQGISAAMQKKDANGSPLVDAAYLAQKTAQIGQAYGVQLNAITDLSNHPEMIGYAVQLMQFDGRW